MSCAKEAGIVAAALAAMLWCAAPAGAVYGKDTEPGPCICNCTSGPASVSLCHSGTITVTSSNNGSVTGGGPGLSATAGFGYSESVSTGQSGCSTQEVAPGECLYYEYKFKVEPIWTLHEGWFTDYWTLDGYNITLVGIALKTKEATPDDC